MKLASTIFLNFSILVLFFTYALSCTFTQDNFDTLKNGWEPMYSTGGWNNYSKFICLKNLKWSTDLATAESMDFFCKKYELQTIDITNPMEWHIVEDYLVKNDQICRDGYRKELAFLTCKIISGMKIELDKSQVGKIGVEINVVQSGERPYFAWAHDYPHDTTFNNQIVLLELDSKVDHGSKTGTRVLVARNYFSTLQRKQTDKPTLMDSLPCCQFKSVGDTTNCFDTSFEEINKKENLKNNIIDPDFTYIGTSFNYTWMLSLYPMTIEEGEQKCEMYKNKSTQYTYYKGKDRVDGVVLGQSPLTYLNEDKYLYNYFHAEFLKRNIHTETPISAGNNVYGHLGAWNKEFKYFNFTIYSRNFSPAPAAFALCYRKFTPDCKPKRG